MVKAEQEELSGKACGYWMGLAFATGLDVRPNEGAVETWKAELLLSEKILTVKLSSPDGSVRADKMVEVKEPCQDAIEVLAILLAAHIPVFDLRFRSGTTATRDENAPVVPSSKESPENESDDTFLPPNHDLQQETPTTARLAVAPMLVLLASKPRYLVAAGGELDFHPCMLGLRLAGGYSREKVRNGRISITELAMRLVAGYTIIDADVFFSQVGALAGTRLTSGSATGLYQNGSATITSAELGLATVAGWRFEPSLDLLVEVSATRLLPKPAFVVAGTGKVFRTPDLLLEISVGMAWSMPL